MHNHGELIGAQTEDIEDEEATTYKETEREELRKKLEECLSTLSPREAEVLRLRFGLVNGYPKTLVEVGKQFDVTMERIRQIEAKALRKMRHPSRSRKIRDFQD